MKRTVNNIINEILEFETEAKLVIKDAYNTGLISPENYIKDMICIDSFRDMTLTNFITNKWYIDLVNKKIWNDFFTLFLKNKIEYNNISYYNSLVDIFNEHFVENLK